jgi:hypothetical protein
MSYPFVQAKFFRKGGNLPPTRVVIHDMEAPEKGDTAESVAQYFQRIADPASAHYCVTPDTRILTGDLRWALAGDLAPGDQLVAIDEFNRNARGRRYQSAQIEIATRRVARCLTVTLEDGRKVTSSTDHWWLAQLGGAKWEWVAADALKVGDTVNAPLVPWNAVGDEGLSWLAGLLDGEGSLHRNSFEMTFSQAEGPVMDRALEVLDSHGFPYRIVWRPPGKEHHKKIGIVSVSGVQANLELLGRARPVRFIERAGELLEGRFLGSRTYNGRLAIVSIEDAGEREVVSLRTTSRTFFAEGVVSHNCVDVDSVVQCVKEEDTAYHAPPNSHSIGIEHAGYASQTARDWADDYSEKMLTVSAALTADICRRYGIPVEYIDSGGLLAGKRGITTHAQVSKAWRQSDHTDPGPNFPIIHYIDLVRGSAPTPVPGGRPVVNSPVITIIAHATWNGGYIQVGSDGGTFSWGAPNYGSTGSVKLNSPIVDADVSPSGAGYWLVAADGGVFAFGDAGFFGSAGAMKLAKPIVAIKGTPSGKGYWLTGSDGGVFSYGDAQYKGSVEFRG